MIKDFINAIDTSTKWAKRSKIEFGNDDSKGLFGIVQGGLYKDLREESIKNLIKIGFDGYAMGGLAVGELVSDVKNFKRNNKFFTKRKTKIFNGCWNSIRYFRSDQIWYRYVWDLP